MAGEIPHDDGILPAPAWAAHMAFTARRRAWFSSRKTRTRDARRELQDQGESDPLLRERWELKTAEKQPYNEFRLKTTRAWSVFPAIRVRSAEHPTIVVLTKARTLPRASRANVAAATRCPMVVLSSAWPGWFRDATEFATPVDCRITSTSSPGEFGDA